MEDFFQVFKYSSFSTGYHVYKDMSIPIIGDDSLTCERKEHNEHDKNVPLNWSKVASKFLQFTNHHICVEETGKKAIIPVIYFLWRCKSYNMGKE